MGALHLRKSLVLSPKDMSATASLILKAHQYELKKICIRELFTVQAKSSHDAFG